MTKIVRVNRDNDGLESLKGELKTLVSHWGRPGSTPGAVALLVRPGGLSVGAGRAEEGRSCIQVVLDRAESWADGSTILTSAEPSDEDRSRAAQLGVLEIVVYLVNNDQD